MTTSRIDYLKEVLHRMIGKRILVVGDVGVDEYVKGHVERISPEAPVPVVEVQSIELSVGMSANVAINVKALGGDPLLLSVVGQDVCSEQLMEELKKFDISSAHLISDKERPTTKKTRVMSGQHHVVRVDYEKKHFLSNSLKQKLILKAKELVNQCDGVVIQDYAKGVIDRELVSEITRFAHQKNKFVFVDPHRTASLDVYRGTDLIKPNFPESLALSGMNYDEYRDDFDKILEVGFHLLRQSQSKQIVMTRGKDSMLVFEPDSVKEIPVFSRSVFDVTGAGDCVISTLALAYSSGVDLYSSCALANFASTVVIQKVGCVPCELNELKQVLESYCP